MNTSIVIVDDFCEQIEEVRQSALESGFGTWAPNKGEVGSSVYEGMSFWGKHSLMMMALAGAIGKAVFPNSMFFRICRPETEAAYVHSDRHSGAFTCVAYLSEHKEVSGTGFYKHRRTGLNEMPTMEMMQEMGILEELKHDMVSGGENEWEQLDFVRGQLNRAVIFKAPLFHARCPKNGLGDTEETARMVWVSHFNL